MLLNPNILQLTIKIPTQFQIIYPLEKNKDTDTRYA